jgi:hypothetical protein
MNTKDSSKPAFSVDYQSQVVVSYFQQPADNSITLWDKWQQHFEGVEQAVVCMSGGLDSQFAAWVLQQLGIEVHAKTYALLWEDNIANANDVLMSMRFCERNNIRLELIELDFQQFVRDQEHLHLGETYRCHSPQLTFHMKFLEQLGNSLPIVMGGEAPRMTYNVETAQSNISQFQPAVYTQPFENFAAAKGIDLTRDLFRLDAETQYLSFAKYCDSVQAHKHYVEERNDNRVNGYVARVEFYQSFDAPVIPMLYKNHGFETVKKTLACRTGVYNQFDVLYRHPMESALMREKWYGALTTQQHYRRGEFNQLLDRHSLVCAQPGMTAVNMYSMDF